MQLLIRSLILNLFFQVSDALKNDYITNDFLGGMGLKNCVESNDWKNAANLTAQQNTTMEICNSTRDFYSMQYSLIINIFMVFLGGICFFISAIYIVKDKERVERFVAGNLFILYYFKSFLSSVHLFSLCHKDQEISKAIFLP